MTRKLVALFSGFGKFFIISSVVVLAVGCGSGGSGGDSSSLTLREQVLSGSVGDGPVVGADIVITDSDHNEIVRTVSDSQAKYQATLPKGTKYPVTVTATGGTDLVSGMAPSFEMVSGSADSSDTTININPFSTFIIKTAGAMPGGLTYDNVANAKSIVLQRLGFGLDDRVIPDPIASEVTNENVANIVKSSETVGEMVRRVSSALLLAGTVVSNDQVIDTLAADIADGVIDGVGAGADARVAAISTIVSAQVLIEAMRNQLYVDGVDVTARLDSTIAIIAPTSMARSADVPITAGMIAQAKVAIEAAQATSPGNTALLDIATALNGIPDARSSASELNTLLAQAYSTDVNGVVAAVVQGSENELEKVNSAVRTSSAPIVYQPTPTPVIPTPSLVPGVTPQHGVFELAATNLSAGESSGAVDITINRVSGSDGVASVEWRTLTFNGYGTADWATDFGSVYPPVAVTFANGETSKHVTVAISSDSVYEGNETFTVQLQNATGGASLGSNILATVTIVDDDVATASSPVPTPTPVPAPAAGKYPTETAPVSVTIASLAKPGYLKSVTHPQFGTQITRITDNAAFGASNVRHYYSKVTPWNSDGSLLNINRRLIDGKTFKLMRTINNVSGEYRWSHTKRGIIYTMKGLEFSAVDVLNGDKKQVLRTFAGYDLCQLGPWEGNISNDDRTVALACKSGSDAYAVVYDISKNTIVASKKLSSGGWAELDWLTISQSGNYVLALWNFSTGKGVDIYNRDMTNQRKLINFSSSHGDLGYDTNGNEVFVQFVGSKGYINAYRLKDGYQFAALGKAAGSNTTLSHISCRNIKRPGWCYVSTHDSGGTMRREVFAVKIEEGNNVVQRFTHHQSTSSTYAAQVQAVPNADGTQVIFASDWGGSEINSYVVKMP